MSYPTDGGGSLFPLSLLETAYIRAPDGLACLSRLYTLAISDNFFRADKILVLWQPSKCVCAKPTLGETISRYPN